MKSLGEFINNNTLDGGLPSILQEVRCGDCVQLIVDKDFFKSDRDERYAGYVVGMDSKIIGLSATHPLNNTHGYDGGNTKHSMKTIPMEVSKIKQYRIIPQLTPVDKFL